ncbi:FAD-dependent oxidoreductase [Bradyrhizobium sp. Arg68]|uniref:FAD-dependent oxidoreductase n=1 Tax=Bradyrhizobium ivorense TaxID=2511166 RepID=UPI001E4C749C|nr:FAD-dependent oxidoreductase [Bradyrhizobium ivorense]
MQNKLPSHVEYLIIGGGIIGLSVAYHLTRLGYRDVLLLERNQLPGMRWDWSLSFEPARTWRSWPSTPRVCFENLRADGPAHRFSATWVDDRGSDACAA